jgi:hypothetical protein
MTLTAYKEQTKHIKPSPSVIIGSGAPSLGSPLGASSTASEKRCFDVNSVRTLPKISVLPYSTNVISPGVKMTATDWWSKLKRSLCVERHSICEGRGTERERQRKKDGKRT